MQEREKAISDDVDQPIISARRSRVPNDWHGMITWPDGRKERVNGFASCGEVADWIANDSARWLDARQRSNLPL
jgi:hypothetical protein